MVSITGMGGLGKTTLAKKVYDDADVKKHFKFCVWITLSPHLMIDDVLKDMIQRLFLILGKPKPRGLGKMDHNKLRAVISQFLQKRRYLIKTFRIRTCPPHLKIISEKILHKCEGLPLAIVAISGVLATKDHCRIDEWEMVHRSIAAELEDNNKLRSATRILSLSYSDLPFNLKSCLLYFSIFPPGTPVNNRRLIRLFIAEGFVKEKEGMALEEDMEGAPLEEFPTQISGLRLLKYLSLRHTMVHRIPSSIGKLQNLETLDLKHTKVTELPNEIVKLKKISHLLVYSYEMEADSFIKAKSGFKAPSHIGSLQSLHRLSLLDAKDCDETLMSELGKLTQLRRLGILNLKKSDGKMLCSSIEKMVNLRALSVNSDNSEVIDMEFLTSPPLLQRLYLAGCLTKLPEWISSLDSLVTLVLKWSRLQDDPSPSLQHLPNLLHLELIQVYDGEAMCFQAGGFPRLKLLALNKLERLKTITVEKGAMPCLKKLVVQSCKSLERVPQGIRHLSKLKVLEFFDMPRDLVMLLHPSKEVATSHHQVRCRRRLWNMLCFQRILVSCYELLKKVVPLLGYGDTLEVEDDDDYHQVQHIPEVYCTYQTEGIWDVYRVDSIRKGNCCEESTDVMRDYEWKL
ncbi:Disease resistance protein RPM1 [Linum grandiflorum]